MPRSVASFTRPKARYKQNPTVLVLCEDSQSCRIYLEDAARHFRAHAKVEIAHCGMTDPLGIVTEGAKRKRGFDFVYCAIDRDTHKNFDQAVKYAKTSDVELIVSYPCYEFWLLLHFGKTRKTEASVGAQSAANRIVHRLCAQEGMAEYAKGGNQKTFELLLNKLPIARANATWALKEAVKEENLDPSTRMHDLIAEFEKLGNVIAV
jgi:hypothetical protein